MVTEIWVAILFVCAASAPCEVRGDGQAYRTEQACDSAVGNGVKYYTGPNSKAAGWCLQVRVPQVGV